MPTGEDNLFGLTQYDNATSFFGGNAVLSKGVGYGVLVGFGAFFTIVTTILVWLDIKFAGHPNNSENFQTAGRRIKTGLISVDVVSHWTWSITLLQSSTVAWNYGVSGPFWYAAGATLQIMLFGVMAVQIKRKAPNAHTILEVVRLRWGKLAHLVFFYLFFANNLFITSTLIVGAGAVITTLTGVPVNACCMLIPLGVVLYCSLGGLKAAFISSYLHSTIIYATILLFVFTAYVSGANGQLGSISEVYDRLLVREQAVPIVGNKNGAILTMFSSNGLEFGWIFFASCFGWVWADQGFWQSAIAARPSAAYKGYILGGLLWFAVPFTLATTCGLSALALDLPLSTEEVAQGLVPPAVAYFFFGKGGVTLILIIIFMAVTSSGSAEMVAVSSLASYDIYKTYINPRATGRQVLLVSRLAVLSFGLLAGVFCIILLQIGININWLFFVVGLLVASVFPPITFLITWVQVPKWAAITAALGGQFCAIIAWLVSAQILYGKLDTTTTSASGPSLAGNITAIVISFLVCTIWTWVAPDKDYTWDDLKVALAKNVEVLDNAEIIDHEKDSPQQMAHAYRMTWAWALGLTLVTFILWPLLALPAGAPWSLGYFTFWVILAMIWGIVAATIVVFYPLIESAEVIKNILLLRPADHSKGVNSLRPRTLPVASPPTPDSDTGSSNDYAVVEGAQKGAVKTLDLDDGGAKADAE